MEESINTLIKNFYEIRDMGYVESVNNYNNGIGLTFEKLLGKDVDNFSYPDYYQIELKSRLAYTKSPVHMFTLSPEGKEFFEVRRLWETYGHIGIDKDNYKKLNNSAVCNKLTRVGIDYYFSLNVNYAEEKVELLVYNNKKELIDNYSYWTFNRLKESLERKLSYLAIVKAWDNKIKGKKCYKYYRLNIYELTDFNNFLKLIEEGKIRITLCVGVFKSGKREGEMHDHGTIFEIFEDDLELLFKKIKSI